VDIGDAKGSDRRPLVLCRPTPMATKVIRMTELESVATVRSDLPLHWPETVPVVLATSPAA
jgi:hypothetical protein